MVLCLFLAEIYAGLFSCFIPEDDLYYNMIIYLNIGSGNGIKDSFDFFKGIFNLLFWSLS